MEGLVSVVDTAGPLSFVVRFFSGCGSFSGRPWRLQRIFYLLHPSGATARSLERLRMGTVMRMASWPTMTSASPTASR